MEKRQKMPVYGEVWTSSDGLGVRVVQAPDTHVTVWSPRGREVIALAEFLAHFSPPRRAESIVQRIERQAWRDEE